MKKNLFLIFLFVVLSHLASFSQAKSLLDSVRNFDIDVSKYRVYPININSNNSDYAPVTNGRQLYFTSGRKSQLGIVLESDEDLLDLYVSEKIDSITFTEPQYLSKILNTPYNDGPASLNEDMDFIVYGSNIHHQIKYDLLNSEYKVLQLYGSEKVNFEWEKPTILNFCYDTISYFHPTLNKTGDTLYFASNLPGGYGGIDLYRSILDSNLWTVPENLGSKINSAYNEVFPFISDEHILYFSSDDPTGFGGLDIYTINLDYIEQSKRALLDKEVNSEMDDFGICYDVQAENGYFSSNRLSEQKDDIFYFYNKYSKFRNCKTFVKPSYCYTFYEENSLEENDTLGLIYEWDLGDGTKIKGLEAKHCYRKSGEYLIELNIIEEASGALFYNDASFEFEIEDSSQIYINCPDTIGINKLTEIDNVGSNLDGYSIIKSHWNFGDQTYSKGRSGLHIYDFMGEFDIKLAVTAINENTQLEEQFCVSKKVIISDFESQGNNIFVEGQGFSNANRSSQKKKISSASTVSDSDSLNYKLFLGSSRQKIPLSHSLFKDLDKVSESYQDSLYMYTSGNYKSMTQSLSNFKKAKKNGFESAAVVGFEGEEIIKHQARVLDRILIDTLEVKQMANLYAQERNIDIPYKKTFELQNIRSYEAEEGADFRVFLGNSKVRIPLNDRMFKGLAKVDEEQIYNMYSYTSGSYNSVNNALKNYFLAIENGFEDAVVLKYKEGNLLADHKMQYNKIVINYDEIAALDEALMAESETRVYFKFNNYFVGKVYFSTLDSIAHILKTNNDYTLDVYSYTDTVGNHDYNMKLSVKRANSVKNYLVKKDVALKRIRMIPLGESKTNNKHKDEDAKLNRRVSLFLRKAFEYEK